MYLLRDATGLPVASKPGKSAHTHTISSTPYSAVACLQLCRKLRTGAALVELAVSLPLILFLFVLAVDYARAFYFTQVLSSCARNGAAYAADQIAAKDSPYTSVQQAAIADAPAFMRNQLTVTQTSGSATTSVTSTAGTDVDSTYNYVQVSVSYQFSLITNIPWMAGTQTLTRVVRMRVVPAVPG